MFDLVVRTILTFLTVNLIFILSVFSYFGQFPIMSVHSLSVDLFVWFLNVLVNY